MNRRNFFAAALGIFGGILVAGSAKASTLEEVPLVGTWFVFDYSVEPVQNWDLEIVQVKDDVLVIRVDGTKGEARYDASKRSIDVTINGRRYQGDIRQNDRGVWVMKGISTTSSAKETSTFTAILQKR